MKNWADDYSNNYTTCLEQGNWAVLKNGEGDKELYRNGKYLTDLPSMYYYADVFDGGIILNGDMNGIKNYLMFNNKSNDCQFRVSGKSITMTIENELIVFTDVVENERTEVALFDPITFEQLSLSKDGQLGLDL